MGQTITAERDQANVPLGVTVSRDGGITGLTIEAKIFNGEDTTQWLDFDDGVFKAAAHVDDTLSVPEVNAAEAPGLYAVDGGFDLSAITLPAATDTLLVQYTITAGGETGTDTDTIQLVTEFLASTAAYMGGIWVDANNGTAGTVVGVNGTPELPVTGLADARTLADAIGFRQYFIVDGYFQLEEDHDNWTIISIAEQGDQTGGRASMVFNGYTFANSMIKGVVIWDIDGAGPGVILRNAMIINCNLFGTHGATTEYQNCMFYNCDITDDDGLDISSCDFFDCRFKSINIDENTGTGLFGDTGNRFYSCVGDINIDSITLGSSDEWLLDNWNGRITLGSGLLPGAASAGAFGISGKGDLVNGSSLGSVLDSTGFLSGATLERIDGLVGDNQVIAVLTKDANDNVLTQRLRVYDTLANAQTDDGATGLLETYLITATYDAEDVLATYEMVRS